MEPQKDEQGLPDRSELSKTLYPQVTKRGGTREDVPAYRVDMHDDMKEEKLVYDPPKMAVLGLMYVAPAVLFLFLIGQMGIDRVSALGAMFAGIIAGGIGWFFHGIIRDELNAVGYNLQAFFRTYWASVVPVVLVAMGAVNLLPGVRYAGIVAVFLAGVGLFLLIGYILARVETHRYKWLITVTAGSWALAVILLVVNQLLH